MKNSKSTIYKKNGIYKRMENSEHKKLTNFVAWIEREIRYIDPTLKDIKLVFEIRGKDENGNDLPVAYVPSEEFENLKWILKVWGSIAYILELRLKDIVRLAILEHSHERKIVDVYKHTGFIEIDGNRLFLHRKGAISSEGHVDTIMVELPLQLQDYCLPEPPKEPEELRESIKALLQLLSITPNKPEIGYLMLACWARAIVSVIKPVDVSVFLVGETGAKKSSIAGVVQALFGSEFDHKNFPANWSSSPAALERQVIAAKNVVLVIDEFSYSKEGRNGNEKEKAAEQVFRCVANQAPRSISRVDQTLKEQQKPGAFVLATGEHIPKKALKSMHSRIMYAKLDIGDVDEAMLSRLQEVARQGTLAKVTSAFIQYVLKNYDQLMEKLPDRENKYQMMAKKLLLDEHGRRSENVASLVIALKFFFYFAQQSLGWTKENLKKRTDMAGNSFVKLAKQQESIIASRTHCAIVFEAIKEGFKDGKIHLRERSTDKQPKTNADQMGWKNGQAKGKLIGWCDSANQSIYILANEETLATLISLIPAAEQGLVPPTRTRFWKAIKEDGGLKSVDTSKRHRMILRIKVSGKEHTVYHVDLF